MVAYFEEYVRTHHQKHYAIDPEGNTFRSLFIAVAGLAGETGEVCDVIKKIVRGDRNKSFEERRQELLLELGDVLHYLTFLGQYYGYSLDDIAKGNIEKLVKRHGS
jgi:NTP pyrophosphatase (non-canonical NTP hydrolase)